MSRTGTKSVVYHGDSCIGEAEVFPIKTHHFQFPNNEIRISHLSPPSERCPPLSILQTISPFSVRCKIQCKFVTDQSPIHRLYFSCFQELKTAVVLYGDEELHLVAMPTKVEKFPCFWCCSVPLGLYGSCLGMLNLRCLAIVFDLDETLIVANTMKSFEDRIEILSHRIDGEDDPVRVSGMSAELKRYLEDKALLKQYVENDSVLDNGRFIFAQNEEVPPLSEGQGSVIRPIIRLQEKNVVLTRINPEIRDTSVLVRLRTAWEDLRSYLTAKGRKRFEVFVCTMAERDYALEMWRLLDPEAHLISSKNLLDRVVCVKSGSRKSLLNVFQDSSCHPKMAMVIDDRLNVWDNKDQPRVHVVPAFAPYYAPQAETANAVPVLCVARNVACNVRGGFFKEFDENLLRRIFEFYYEDEILDLPSAPDVGDYLTPEDANVVPNGNRDFPISDGMNEAEVERRFNQLANTGNGRQAPQQANSTQSSFLDGEVSINRAPFINKDIHTKVGSLASFPSSISIAALHEIGRRCDSKVEFRSVISSSKDLQFSVEVLFSAEKIGSGMGKTRKEAQLHAAENALHYLANSYVAFIAPDTGAFDRDLDKLSLENENENGFLKDIVSPDSELLNKGAMPNANISEQLGQADDAKKLSIVVSEIKELCPTNGLNLVFHDQAPALMNLCEGHYYSQVEISGRVLGKGIGLSSERAKLLAAEEALRSLKVTVQQTQKRLPRSSSSHVVPTKRSKEDLSQG